jgi:hypothetical protein
MKTLSCFIATWVTATLLLLWLAKSHSTQQLDLGGARIILSDHSTTAGEIWHCVWVAAIYSVLNTLVVRFWQMQSDLRKKVV